MNKIASSDVLFMKIASSISIDEADTLKGCMSGKGGNVSQDDLLKVAGLIGYMQKTAKGKGGGGGGLPSAGIDAVTTYLKSLKPGKGKNNVDITQAMKIFNDAMKDPTKHHLFKERGWSDIPKYLLQKVRGDGWSDEYAKLLASTGSSSGEIGLRKFLNLYGLAPWALSQDAIKARQMALQMSSRGMDPSSANGKKFFDLYENITKNLSKGMSVNQSDLNTYNATAQDLGLPQFGGVNGAPTPNEVNTYLKSVGETKSYANRMDKQNKKLINDMNSQKLKNQKLKSDLDAMKKEKKLQEQAERDKYWWQNPWAASTLGIGAGAAGLYGLNTLRDIKKSENDRRGGAIVF